MELGTLLLIVVIPGVVLYIWYAKLISRRNTACEALSSIGVQLKKRQDLQNSIARFFAMAGNNPELRSAETTSKTQDPFAEAEAHTSTARL